MASSKVHVEGTLSEDEKAALLARQKKVAAIVELTKVMMVFLSSGGMPSGHLYAYVMGTCSFEVYNFIIASLKQGKLIDESGFFIKLTPGGQKMADIYKAELIKEGE